MPALCRCIDMWALTGEVGIAMHACIMSVYRYVGPYWEVGIVMHACIMSVYRYVGPYW